MSHERRTGGARPRVGISRCLVGDLVRYDGAHRRSEGVLALAEHVELVPVCPEVEVGMGIPREPIQLVADPRGRPAGRECVRLVGVTSGTDWTARMDAWAHDRLRTLESLSGFVLKARSPSCGPNAVAVWHGHEGVTRTGRGLFAQALQELRPELPVVDEDGLRTATARGMFLARVMAYHQRPSDTYQRPSGT